MKGPSSRKQTLIEWFVASAGVVLAITGLAKAWTSSGVDKIQALERVWKVDWGKESGLGTMPFRNSEQGRKSCKYITR